METGYWIIYAILAVWVLFDAKQRKNHIVGWPAMTFLVGPIALPIYFAKRHLKEGEVREGGAGWNVLKNFTLLWTLMMVVVGFAGLIGVSEVVGGASSEAEQAGAAIGATLGLGMIGVLWFVVAASALLIGMLLKRASIVETGPTGPLAAKE